MGEVKQKFTGDIEDLKNKMAQIQAEYIKLKDKMYVANQEGEKGHEKVAAAITGQISEVAHLVTSYGTLVEGINFVREAYSGWLKDLQSISEETSKINRDLLSALQKYGKLKEAAALSAYTEGAPARGVTREQAVAAVSGLEGAAPTMPVAKKIAIATEVTKLAPFSKVEDLQQFAEISGRLGTVFPEKTAEQLANLTQSLYTRTGKDIGLVTSPKLLSGLRGLVGAGALSVEEGLAYAAQVIQKQMGGRGTALLEQMFDEINAREGYKVATKGGPKTSGHPRPLSETDKAKNRFASATAQEAWNMLQTDPAIQQAILGQTMAGKIGGQYQRITTAEVKTTAAAIQAEEMTALNQTVAEVAETRIGKKAVQQQQHVVKKEFDNLARADEAYRISEMEEFVEEKFRERIRTRGWGPGRKAWAESEHAMGKIFAAIDNLLMPGSYKYDAETILRRSGEFSESEVQEFSHGVNKVLQNDQTPITNRLDKLNRNILTNQATNAAQAARAGRE